MTPPVVLIVDDDDLNRKLARDVLRASGLATIEAANGAEAIAVALDRVPDLVLLDLRLPDLDGGAVLARLRAEPTTARIPVVAVTAVAGAREALVDAGFDGYLEKPIDVRDLPAMVRRHCPAR